VSNRRRLSISNKTALRIGESCPLQLDCSHDIEPGCKKEVKFGWSFSPLVTDAKFKVTLLLAGELPTNIDKKCN